MAAILYPVAANAELALSQPRARAARASDAERLAGEAVVFTTDAVGPAFASEAAALAAYGERVEAPDAADRFCRLAEQFLPQKGRSFAPVEPTNEDGHRWPKPGPAPRTAWRLMVSYWRIATAERPIEAPQARKARRAKQTLAPETLRAIARQPLRPVEPQQPLDIGLFETRLPENPSIVVPDE